jgi:endonuclease-8
MLTQFDHGETLYSHNQLYGVWHITRRGSLPSTNRQLRVALHTDTHSALLFSATDVALWPTEHLDEHPFLRKLGPDVLDETLTASRIVARLTDKLYARRSVASLYLDQGFIAGIGNYLRSEILFAAKVPPRARPVDLASTDIQRLARTTLRISLRSYRTRGITVTRATAKKLQRQGGGFESYRFAVFGRKHQQCIDCGSKIVREEIGARRLYWCPDCQST